MKRGLPIILILVLGVVAVLAGRQLLARRRGQEGLDTEIHEFSVA